MDLFSGLLDLPWWGYVVAALVLTHITIAAVTIYLHRHQAHRALDLHPIVSHFFRFWLWLTTGMVTKEWAAIHRKHHAKCETADDPHSPQMLRHQQGAVAAACSSTCKESHNQETMERYGHGTPDDWIERNVYSPLHVVGRRRRCWRINFALFGIVPGVADLGDADGLDPVLGRRRHQRRRPLLRLPQLRRRRRQHQHRAVGHPDRRRGAAQQPPRLRHVGASSRPSWYEFDIGWMYIRILETLGLATVKKVAPKPRFAAAEGRGRPRHAAGRDHATATTCCRATPSRCKRTYAAGDRAAASTGRRATPRCCAR